MKRLAAGMVVLLSGLAAVGVVGVSPAVPAAAVDQVVTIHIRDNAFTPPTLSIAPGTTVRWVNDGRNTHNVTAAAGHAYGSGNLKPGRSYVHTFEHPGQFAYYCSLHGTPTSGQHASLVVGDVAAATPVTPVGQGRHRVPTFRASGRTIRVPSDAPTIQRAVDRAEPGDLVLVAPGVYKEAVTVATDGVVIRGMDRNRTILDGEFERANGVFVAGANGVAVENLTARNYTDNGFFWNGVVGYRGSYLTAYRNGDYGIYAYDSQYGQFDHSYASGSPDSGFYIGQCNPCHAVITDVVSRYNELGYSGTNASSDLYLVHSDWSYNRTGIVPNTLDSEELPPQGHAVIAANVVTHNGEPRAARSDTPEFDAAFGGGIVVVGGVGNQITKNRMSDNKVGVAIAPNPAIQQHFYASTGNQVTDNMIERSSMVDLAILGFGAHDENCFSGNTFSTSAPRSLEQLMPCGDAAGTGDPTAGALDIAKFLDTSGNPRGRSYKLTPIPPIQRSLPHAATAKARPAGRPVRVSIRG